MVYARPAECERRHFVHDPDPNSRSHTRRQLRGARAEIDLLPASSTPGPGLHLAVRELMDSQTVTLTKQSWRNVLSLTWPFAP